MSQTVLVAYASKHGTTREVAESVASTLRSHGFEVEARAAGEVTSLDGVDAVVLGGGLYMARLHADARRFLARHRDRLAELPLAVFAMGPGSTNEKDMAASRKQLDHALAKVSELRPVEVAIFGGALDPTKLRFPFNHMPACDARDWDAIEAWALRVADAFAGAAALRA
jgi:menaquinone-dependent protoporphyrinogen oxidase